MGPKWDSTLLHPALTWVPCGKPRCTNIFPDATHMGHVWTNQDVPTPTRFLPTSVPCGRTKMPPYLSECYPHWPHVGLYMGPKWDFNTFAPSIDMGPVWENPDAPTSSRMQPKWVLCGQTKMYPHVPGCHPHQSTVGEPRCTHIFPNATHIGPMWDFKWAPSGIRHFCTLD